MKKLAMPLIAVAVLLMSYAITNGQTYTHVTTTYNPLCDTHGRVNNIWYSNCFQRVNHETDDTNRLNEMISQERGEKVFNEIRYDISSTLTVAGYRILRGTGIDPKLSGHDVSPYNVAKIYMNDTAGNYHSVFTLDTNNVASGAFGISIRDLTLIENCSDGASDVVCGYDDSNVGIKAEGDYSNTLQGIHFDVSNVFFDGFGIGIKINATDTGHNWRFDHVLMDHLSFNLCKTGVYVDSYNAGLDIRNLHFFSPAGGYGIKILHGTYTSIDTLIGDGPLPGTHTTAAALVYIEEHGVTTIKNSVSERFDFDLDVEPQAPNGLTFPINLINNHFQNLVLVKNSTIVSTANQFGLIAPPVSPQTWATITATAYNSRVYSLGDKFCPEGYTRPYYTTNPCEPASSSRRWQLTGTTSQVLLDSRHDGSLTIGSTDWGTINSTPYPYYALDGTLVYCTDCQQTSSCTGSGTGALAKKIAGSWKCN